MFTEEELLEAVDILVEEYGFDEDEAIELVNETHEMELDVISEAVDMLIENYDLDEDEAINLVLEGAMKDATQGNLDALQTGLGAAGVTIAGYGLYKGGKYLYKNARRNAKTRKELKHIARTGKRTSKRQRLIKENVDNKVAYTAGAMLGAYTATKIARPVIDKSVKKIYNAYEKGQNRNKNKAELKKREAVKKYRKDRIKQKLKRK